MKIERDALLSMTAGPARAKLLGSFYTPEVTAATLARWVIRTGGDRILEPSAGNGALVKAALARVQELTPVPACDIVAFDIDPTAISELRSKDFPRTTIVEANFLHQTASEFRPFDAVLANPPFNRNHSIPEEARKYLRQRFATHGASGLWVHFLVHATEFLRVGGRLAFIVPRSAIFTKHGDALLRRISDQFRSVGIYELPSRPMWSAPAEEAGAVILADGYKEGRAETYMRGYITAEGLAIDHVDAPSPSFEAIEQAVVRLGEIASISIGAVTGRNKVFLLSEADRRSAGINLNNVVPVVSRTAQLRGVCLDSAELTELAKEGHKTLLLRPTRFSKRIRDYLEAIPAADLESVVWFKKRNPWWLVQIEDRYDAVFTYMNDGGPRVVLLGQGIVCTNTLHRIAFNEMLHREQKAAAALTVLSTYGQLAAEKIGRAYGGGLLKFEIGEARRIPVLNIPSVFTDNLLADVNLALRENNRCLARDLVDSAYMPKLFGRKWERIRAELQSELADARKKRRIAVTGQET
ncbi:class I SAM-dependent DNA methyltransferase [Burkholderia sp. RF4-BP95]|uniref:HsdM family class I SAM-dependent methyltransferase n=1 Tax=Burkholderia sp. RF4-BP95 TaxID=1637845 RepID=UPI0009E928A9|nr:N-6 DNA methylase [Burkholderia sp. RF4-BP95]